MGCPMTDLMSRIREALNIDGEPTITIMQTGSYLITWYDGRNEIVHLRTGDSLTVPDVVQVSRMGS